MSRPTDAPTVVLFLAALLLSLGIAACGSSGERVEDSQGETEFSVLDKSADDGASEAIADGVNEGSETPTGDDADGNATTDSTGDAGNGSSGHDYGFPVSGAGEMYAYVSRVSYMSKLSEAMHNGETSGVFVARSAEEWESLRGFFVTANSNAPVDENGNADEPEMTGDLAFEDIPSFEQSFFDAGGSLVVKYADLSSSGLNPTIVSASVSGEVVTVQYDDGSEPGMMYTQDMSGFAVVIEVPVGQTVTSVNLETK